MTPENGDFILDPQNTCSTVFDELYDAYKSSVYRFAYYLSRNREESDELFQETWFRVVQYSAKLPAIRDFRPWVYAITANIHRDLLRKKRIRRMFFSHSAMTSEEEYQDGKVGFGRLNREIMDESDRVDLGLALSKAMKVLPARQRRVFVLKEIEGFKHTEIGAILGIPVGTVKSLLYRAVKRLRRELSAYDPQPSVQKK